MADCLRLRLRRRAFFFLIRSGPFACWAGFVLNVFTPISYIRSGKEGPIAPKRHSHEQSLYSPRAGFSEGLGRIKVQGRWGFIDMNGKLAIAPQFENAWDFSDGIAPVLTKGRWGYVDRVGRMDRYC